MIATHLCNAFLHGGSYPKNNPTGITMPFPVMAGEKWHHLPIRHTHTVHGQVLKHWMLQKALPKSWEIPSGYLTGRNENTAEQDS